MPEEYVKDLLKRNLEVSEESLKILQKMHRAQVIGRTFKILKWLVIIAITLGVYYYIEPYLKMLINNFNQIMVMLGEIKKTSDSLSPNNVPSDLLEKLQNLLPR